VDTRPVVIACDKRKAFAQGSESDEAIQLPFRGKMDCFAIARNGSSLIRLSMARVTEPGAIALAP